MSLLEAFGSAREKYELQIRKRVWEKNPALWAKERLNIDLWSMQAEIAQSVCDNKKTIVKSAHNIGKLLGSETFLPTPTGWTTMGEVRVGDEVLDEMGYPTLVVGKSDKQTPESYRITFDDDTYIDACKDHQWQVLDLNLRPRGVQDWRDHWDHKSSSVKTTQQLVDAGVLTRSGQRRWKIPLADPLQLPEADLPIDPYVLGLWLADGSKANGQISSGPTKLGTLPLIRAAGYDFGEPAPNDRSDGTVFTIYGLMPQLRELGLLGRKRIPMQYLRASEAQRRSLLAGIMDGDGFVASVDGSGTSAVGLDWTDFELANDFYELLMTLGCKVGWSEGEAAYTLNGKRHVTGTRYRMNWRPLENPFRARGDEWWDNTSHRSRNTQRTIVSIEPIEPLTGYCITVDSPRSLYLVGESMIPTHNTYMAAVLVCWWIDVHPNEETRVISTAPTDNQVKKLLWENIRKLHRNFNLTGTVSEAAEWKSDKRDMLAMGRKPSDDNIHAMQGHHAKYLLFILDEAGGVPQQLWTGAEAVTTNPDNRILAIGNPDDPATEFGRIFNMDDPSWKKFTVSAFDTPNFTGEPVTKQVQDTLLDPAWVKEKRLSWGDTSSRWYAKILAEFPKVTVDTLFPVHMLMECVDRTILPKEDQRPDLGVDVARFGDDKTVVISNIGGSIEIVAAWDKTDIVATTERVFDLALRTGARSIRVDASGMGVGVVDGLRHMVRERQPNFVVFDMVGSARPPDPRRWANARAYWHDYAREQMQLGLVSLPDNSVPLTDGRTLYEELEGLRYKMASKNGAIQIESKDDMRARGGKSPDYSDALMYALAPAPDITPDQQHIQPGVHVDGDTVFVDPFDLMMSEEVYVISPY